MFEKEAEKYLIKLLKRLKIRKEDLAENQPEIQSWEKINFVSLNTSNVSKAYQKGAEFGYNKANEWHNIKENPNDLPNDGELVVADNGLTIDCVKFRKNEFGNSWKHDNFELYNVIYWKKLVLSKDRNK